MAADHITADLVRSLLDYDADTGLLRWRVSRGSVQAGAIAGSPNKDGYLGLSIKRTTVLAHRVIWLHVHGVWPTRQIDHINGDRRDNRLVNLRDVAPAVNSQNLTDAHVDSYSGILGVHWHSRDKRWIAQLGAYGKRHHLGTFRTAEEAHAAYLKAKATLHPFAAR